MTGKVKIVFFIFLMISFQILNLKAMSVSVDSLGQRTDGSKIIDIWYSLYDIDGECAEISILPFTASGETLSCNTFVTPSDTGVVSSIGSYHIIWDIGTDAPDVEFYHDRLRIVLYAARPGVDPGGDCNCDFCVDIDGNLYDAKEFCGKCWTVQNLKTTHYSDGTPIANITGASGWSDTDLLETGAYSDFNNDSANAVIHGRLYNWYAVNNPCGLCPDGWHVPSDEEWKELEMCLDMSIAEADDYGCRGTNQGSQLAGNAELWGYSSITDDSEFGSSGFDAFPSGYRRYTGSFVGLSSDAVFWTSNDYATMVGIYRNIHSSWTCVYRRTYLVYKTYGYSVRCVKD